MNPSLNINRWLWLGLLIRLAVMPFTLHTDVIFIHKLPHLLLHGGWDAYGVAAREFGEHYYPPLTLIFFAAAQGALGGIVPAFESFLHAFATIYPKDLLDAGNIFLALFLMKIPYAVFDVALLQLLRAVSGGAEEGGRLIADWAVNPVLIYGTYMMGQIDLLPAFCVVAAFYFVLRRGQEPYAFLFLAAGCLLKISPAVFFPLCLCVACGSWRDVIRFSACFALPVIGSFAVFYMISGDAVFTLFRLFSYNTGLSPDLKMIILRLLQAAVYALVCWHALSAARGRIDYPLLCRYILAVYFAVYWGFYLGWTHYLIWFMPFLLLFIQWQPRWRRPFYALLLVIFLGGLRSREAALGIFAPLHPQFFFSLPSLMDITGFLFNQEVYDQAVKYAFNAGTGIWALFILRGLYAPWPRAQAR